MRAKRALDVVLASVLLVLSAPVVLVAAVAILLVDGRPVLFTQLRDGRYGSPILIRKLRTMHRYADSRLETILTDAALRAEWERFGGLRADPRVLGRLGRFLRSTSIDELPQLFDVLIGRMTLVGPRPLDLRVLPLLDAEILAARRSVRPGLTGVWQVMGRSELDLVELVRIDASYAEGWRLRDDLAVLLRTPAAVLSRRGAR